MPDKKGTKPQSVKQFLQDIMKKDSVIKQVNDEPKPRIKVDDNKRPITKRGISAKY